MAQFVVNSTSVENIISSIKEGEIAIPEIQRPFVWDASKVRDLMDSLYKGFPVGYIIVWKNPDIRLKNGKVSSGKKILIDGQQRITAIEAAVVGQEVVDSTYKKKRIVIAFNPIEEVFEVWNNLCLVNGHSLSHFYHKLHLLNLPALWTSARDISALLPPALRPSSARHIQTPSPRRYRWH